MRCIFFLTLLWTSGISFAQELPRRAFLGIAMSDPNGDSPGIIVDRVYEGSSAAAADMIAKDEILELDGKTITTPSNLIALLAQYQTGDKLSVSLKRKGKEKKIPLVLTGFPEETYPHARVHYGQVKSSTGRHRSFLSIPKGKGPKRPVVYIIQGIDCGSVDLAFNQQGGIGQLISHLHAKGFATYRVEKSGIGDSKGIPCEECNFVDDEDAFAAGLAALMTEERIDTSSIYLLGLSMGGVWGPRIAEGKPIKGLIAYGTIGRSFLDYMEINARRQALLAGTKAEVVEARVSLGRQMQEHLYGGVWGVDAVLEKYPEGEPLIKSWAGRRADDRPLRHLHGGRRIEFNRQLAKVDFPEVWQKVRAPVLTIWGEGDYVSGREDHQLIIDYVNAVRPGTAEMKTVPADHWFFHAENMEESYQNRRTRTNPPLEIAVFETITDWLTLQEKKDSDG
ncbi:MAG: PDZ domain-containing protein [Bacteroidota bacterium]